MAEYEPQEFAAMIATLVTVGLLGGLVVHVWYALALAKLLPKVGGESWKAWVPVVNTMEILDRGRVPSWSIVYLFIPLVQLYGIYLVILAQHRITVQLGRGAGLTVVAALFPPVWASVLAWGSRAAPATAAHSNGQRADRNAVLDAPAIQSAQPVSSPHSDLSGYAMPAAPPVIPPVPAVAEASVIAPAPPVTQAPVIAPAPPVTQTPVAVAPPVINQPPVIEQRAAVELPVVEPPAAVPPPVMQWWLTADGGFSVVITSTTVILGRNPTSDRPEVQAIAVPDSTRTLSKVHAQLVFSDGGWHITDLNSTNGVLVVAVDATEQALSTGGSARLVESFALGKVGVRVSYTDDPQR
ncbi:DUF5684 domain-containing protein [Salinibacterium sp. PAMC 21357]|uniref:DUF5684 domain-containing protein n=1 Tax=Salinibacterium sp. PAMC 21357 TaxID=1112215 RepID=UPI000289F9A5|nr:DUF5684 domain-containing protein [Salinibacterium sp. PAMC 21357]